MAKRKDQTILGLPADRRLASDFRRVVVAGQPVIGTATADEEQIIALARETGGRMLALPPEVSFIDCKALLSLFDEVNDLAERLSAEHAIVKGKLRSRIRHGEARKAYQRGNPR